MSYTKTIILLFAIFSTTISYSQSDFPAFGAFSSEEIKMTQCPFDLEANAIILLDKGVSSYDDQNRLVTIRRKRIKILNSKGFDIANITIPFYAKENFENIGNIKAVTYNFEADGRVSSVEIE